MCCLLSLSKVRRNTHTHKHTQIKKKQESLCGYIASNSSTDRGGSCLIILYKLRAGDGWTEEQIFIFPPFAIHCVTILNTMCRKKDEHKREVDGEWRWLRGDYYKSFYTVLSPEVTVRAILPPHLH